MAAAVAYAIPAIGHVAPVRSGRTMALLIAWLLHGPMLAVGLLGESPPRFGFAPALSVTAWLVLTVYAIERQLFPQLRRAGHWPGWAR